MMKRLGVLVVLAALSVVGMVSCGGGGGDGGNVGGGGTPGVLAGQYTMTGIRYEFSNGLIATENDFVPWSGNMDIGNTTMDIQITLLGESTHTGGPYSATWSSDTTGSISDGTDSIPFTLSNGDMTLVFPDLIIDVGLTADVFIYWHKTSDSHTSLSPERESVGTNDVNISEIKSQLRKAFMK